MESYFSTFISGAAEIITDLLRKKIVQVDIALRLDGLIMYKTAAVFSSVKGLRFFNNTFGLLKDGKDISVSDFVNEIILDRTIQKKLKNFVLTQARTFRVVYSKANQLERFENNLTEKLEDFICRGTSLKVDVRNPDVEFWILARSEGDIFFGTRMTKKQDARDFLEQGELRPELANILCELSEPVESDIFLDPFAGSGAIPFERAKMFKFKKIFAGDNNKEIYTNLAEKIKRSDLKIVVGKWNAAKLGALSDSSVDKIVTDQPWGHYDQNINIEDLYQKSFAEFYRILKGNGILVLLTSQKELVDNILKEYKNTFLVEKQFTILVSGQKSEVLKIRKI